MYKEYTSHYTQFYVLGTYFTKKYSFLQNEHTSQKTQFYVQGTQFYVQGTYFTINTVLCTMNLFHTKNSFMYKEETSH